METTIRDLFDKRDRRFEIPSYQRAYSWEEKDIKHFLEDLSTAGSHYYLGHFLFELKEGYTLCVIDGQQRLTTCIIFFSVWEKERYRRMSAGDGGPVAINLEDTKDYYLKDLRKGIQNLKLLAMTIISFLKK